MRQEKYYQNKIINYLKTAGIYHFKVISANKKGIPDIIGCTPEGKFFAIEVKAQNYCKLSELQKINLDKIKESNGIAFVANGEEGLEKVLDFIKDLTEGN